ncbi:hypothetical protein BN59_00647 [Legionella massiliensis]|uniref:SHSP domain-containing protein n=1 Tax=Legionella massiliensis TaxID=1034943 RepID=A0A078KXF1_9GAMM|nr:Hsp20/alpha crystallin family protein [Legionella massiliensis]CDZ76378.1 hypothetical protein BN59_00647 [Legionella massiliensis]CEE12116.1 hypothetical protein BN1094_00647 [Legionella massiliensis]
MKKELILVLSCALILAAMMSVVNAEDNKFVQKSTHQITGPFDDPVINQLNKIQQTMDHMMQMHLSQIHSNQLSLAKSMSTLENTQEIQMEEHNNKLIYKIKKEQGTDSKVNVSIKEGLLIINTHTSQKTVSNEGKNKNISFSQSNYSQSFPFPDDYDSNSMDLKDNDSNLIITFKKKG